MIDAPYSVEKALDAIDKTDALMNGAVEAVMLNPDHTISRVTVNFPRVMGWDVAGDQRGKTHSVTVVREVTTTYKFYVGPDEDPFEAWEEYRKAVQIPNIVRHSEPRPIDRR